MTRDQPRCHCRHARSLSVLAGPALLLALLISSCSPTPQSRLWLPAGDWSRALAIGQSATGSQLGILVEEDRAVVFLPGEGEQRLIFIPLHAPSEIQTHDLPALAGRSTRQAALLKSGSEYRLYWLEDRAVYWSAWDEDAQAASPPRSVNISGGVSEYAVADGPDGQIWLWMAGEEDQAGLYVTSVGGISPADPVVDPQGRRPALAAAEDGLHAVWLRPPQGAGQARLMYSRLDWNSGSLTEPVEIGSRALSATDVDSGPWIGIQGGYAHVFFTVEIQSGLRAGETDTTAHLFPVADPSQVERLGTRLHIQSAPQAVSPDPASRESTRQALDDWEPTREAGSAALTEIAPESQAGDGLSVALRAELPYLRGQRQSQVAVLYFEDGRPHGTQAVTFTPAPSTQPAIASSDDGWLHLVWLERAEQEGQVAYYASTDPRVVEALQGMTGQDVGSLLMASSFAALSGVLFSPLALLWLILPVVVVLSTSFLRQGGESVRRPCTLLSLGVALVAFWGTKLLMLPGLFETTPFSPWYPVMTPWLAMGLRFAVPVAISGIGLLAAWLATYRRGRYSPLFFILVFGVVDGMLTMAVYAERLVGGF